MNHFIRNLLSIGWLLLFILSLTVSPALAQPPVIGTSAQIQSIYQTDISGPQGSTSYGSQVISSKPALPQFIQGGERRCSIAASPSKTGTGIYSTCVSELEFALLPQ